MRTLHDNPHPTYTAAMMADLTAPGSPAEPADGVSQGPATSVWSGGGNGRQRAPDAVQRKMRDGLRSYLVIDDGTADALRLAATAAVASVWGHAVAMAAEAGPMPLASSEPWMESICSYRARLQVMFPAIDLTVLDEDNLELFGINAGLLRLRITEETHP